MTVSVIFDLNRQFSCVAITDNNAVVGTKYHLLVQCSVQREFAEADQATFTVYKYGTRRARRRGIGGNNRRRLPPSAPDAVFQSDFGEARVNLDGIKANLLIQPIYPRILETKTCLPVFKLVNGLSESS